jgi:hypothetical protein
MNARSFPPDDKSEMKASLSKYSTSLSLEMITILSGFIFTLIFGFSLFVIANERINDFIRYHTSISQSATKNVGGRVRQDSGQQKTSSKNISHRQP